MPWTIFLKPEVISVTTYLESPMKRRRLASVSGVVDEANNISSNVANNWQRISAAIRTLQIVTDMHGPALVVQTASKTKNTISKYHLCEKCAKYLSLGLSPQTNYPTIVTRKLWNYLGSHDRFYTRKDVLSSDLSKPRDFYLALSHPSEIRQAPPQHSCRCARWKQYNNLN